ncbi:O-antigen ligase family protein [Arsenicicoccus dermatophilus]|uniref:O-antigen ligase family protein n=1 Tax=Arsenicicoccus dermatophilus TaxID=1076331 RepID=UPI001F4D2195|nr:O-antigen ligase family protein [Arsenicicoccus dermatophilus]MCH8613720.1 O-antigen ligase family protein [Arsenicicoccus dermatophilus]
MTSPGARSTTPIIGPTALAVLALGGYVKGSRYLAWIPVDLTILAGAVVLVVVLWTLAVRRRPGGSPVPLLLWFATLTSGLLSSSSPENTYASQKVIHVFVLAPLCVMGGLVLLDSPRGRRSWLRSVVAVGFVTIALALVDPAGSTSRLYSEGGSTIGLGRAAGGALVVLLTVALTRRKHREFALLLAFVAGYVVLRTASRGPVLASVLAVLAVVALSRTSGRIWRTLLVLLLLALGGAWAASGGADSRLFETAGASAEMRGMLLRYAVDAALHHPLGIGWGGLYDYMGFATLDSGYVQYPHNVIVEVASEGGWAAGAATCAALAVALGRQWRHQALPGELAMTALLLFGLLNALVSGDVNGNRGLWVAIGAALAAQMRAPAQGPPGQDPQGGIAQRPSRSESSDRHRGGPRQVVAQNDDTGAQNEAEHVPARLPRHLAHHHDGL